MSEAELRRRVEDRRKRDGERALMGVVIGLALGLVFALAAARASAPITTAGWGVLSLWSLYFAYQVRRWLWPEDPPTTPSLQFYREEVEQRLAYSRQIWLRSGLPVAFLGLALVIVPPLARGRALLNAAPFFILLVAWAVMFRRQRRHEREALERELADLQALER